MLMRVLALICAVGLAACAQLQPRADLPIETAVPPGTGSNLDTIVEPLEAAHAGESGFRLVSDGREAFALRYRSAEVADRSIDVQTYIWHADTTGLALAAQLLAAADRGVQVRLLVDDLDARAKNAGFAALAAHPNIAVRLFNPFASREGKMAFLGESATSFRRINRRMHNKSWIADNRFAMVGGRNLGNEYFGASDESNFDDLDFALLGDVVRDVSASFDRFWNSPQAYPVEFLDAESVTDDNLARLRINLDTAAEAARTGWYAKALADSELVRQLGTGQWPLIWTARYTFVSDVPAKVTGELGEDASNVGKTLFPAMRGAAHDLTVISPYFVPGDRGAAALVDLAEAGTMVRILTNSLAANDVAAVHGGYAARRKTLLEGGVALYEIKPTGGNQVPMSLRGSSGAALHTKALSIDGERLFVGSYNLDPRSTSLNCEQGVLVDSDALAQEFETLFADLTAGNRAWNVAIVDGDLNWSDGQETRDSEPDATFGRRFQAWFARVFHLESQL